jgi:hypothetical protein
MSNPPAEPLRGDAAWKAHRAAVEKRNDAARKKGRELRAASEAETLRRRRAADKRSSDELPVQPTP